MLEVRGLYAGYKDLQVLKDVSIEVRQGEIVAVIGSNASGKSTMLKAISGLNSPDAGEIWYEGSRIDKLPGYRPSTARSACSIARSKWRTPPRLSGIILR